MSARGQKPFLVFVFFRGFRGKNAFGLGLQLSGIFAYFVKDRVATELQYGLFRVAISLVGCR